MNITTTALSHLGLVSGTFDELGIADLIDTTIPKNRDRLKLFDSSIFSHIRISELIFSNSYRIM